MSKFDKNPISLESPYLYDVLVSPMVTEKSTAAMENNTYTFKVSQRSTKNDIKSAIEKLFKVNVLAVNTLNMKGKVKKFRGRLGKRNDYKKAMVRVAKGQTIDVGVGV